MCCNVIVWLIVVFCPIERAVWMGFVHGEMDDADNRLQMVIHVYL